MNAPFRLLRFRTAVSEGLAVAGARRLLDVYLDDQPLPVGHVMLHAAEPGAPVRWSYLLADGRPTGLQSVHSRHGLESRIIEHYFEDLIADQRHTA
ncbi:MAG: hypothetical protein IT582_06065 [Opitutaceae bacterium]|nr:hypothetical protein [Opitutaceae bacterium]